MIATFIALPNFLWEWRNHFPFLELMRNVRARQAATSSSLHPLPRGPGRDARLLSPPYSSSSPFASSSPSPDRPYRALGWAYLFFLAQMMFLRGKMYYVAPVYPMIFAAGAVWIDRAHPRALSGYGAIWVKPLLALGIFAVGAASMLRPRCRSSVSRTSSPTSMPSASSSKNLSTPHPGVLPQIYADMFGWEEMTQQVAAYYHTLSPDEQTPHRHLRQQLRLRRRHRLLRPPLWPPQIHRRPPVLLALGTPRLYRREHNRPRRGPRREHADQVRQLHHRRSHQPSALPSRRLAPHLPLPRLQVEPTGSVAQTKKLAVGS